MTKALTYVLAALALLCHPDVSRAAQQAVYSEMNGSMPIQVDRVAKISGIPWGMAFLSPSELIFTVKSGKIGVLDLQSEKITWLSATLSPIAPRGQGGLLDVAVPPGQSPWIYFTYSRRTGKGAATTLARARRRGTAITDWQELLITRSATGKSIHYGSRITFDHRGHLFFTVGDRGVRPNGQDLSTHAGSILRVNLDGSVPKDNPFAGSQTALPEIFSFGHRNPQGIFFDRETRRLWAIEHGPRGGDEINLIQAGENYGWPVISYGKEYWGPIQVGEGTAKEGMTQPVKYYVPSIAPASLLVYSGKAFPAWRGNLFAGALKLNHLNRIALDRDGKPTEEERLLEDLDRRIRALVEGPEGWLYFSSDSGDIFRLRPKRP